jgi:hypothetical protein
LKFVFRPPYRDTSRTGQRSNELVPGPVLLQLPCPPWPSPTPPAQRLHGATTAHRLRSTPAQREAGLERTGRELSERRETGVGPESAPRRVGWLGRLAWRVCRRRHAGRVRWEQGALGAARCWFSSSIFFLEILNPRLEIFASLRRQLGARSTEGGSSSIDRTFLFRFQNRPLDLPLWAARLTRP